MKEHFKYLCAMTFIWSLSVVPHTWRVRMAGAFSAGFLFPLLGGSRRIRENLELAMPELTADDRQRIAHKTSNHLGRVLIELFSTKDMHKIAAATPFEGPGVKHLEAAHAEGRSIICVSGHFGNYDVFRSALTQRGHDVGALYHPMKNEHFNAHYVKSISSVGGKMFTRGRSGLANMVRHLKSGGLLALLIDRHTDRGARLTFFGQPAYTATSAAGMALKYNAILVPIYAIRQPDGLSFKIEVETPVPVSDETTMTQALNDSLEAQIRAHPTQWFWTHRRWQVARDKKTS